MRVAEEGGGVDSQVHRPASHRRHGGGVAVGHTHVTQLETCTSLGIHSGARPISEHTMDETHTLKAQRRSVLDAYEPRAAAAVDGRRGRRHAVGAGADQRHMRVRAQHELRAVECKVPVGCQPHDHRHVGHGGLELVAPSCGADETRIAGDSGGGGGSVGVGGDGIENGGRLGSSVGSVGGSGAGGVRGEGGRGGRRDGASGEGGCGGGSGGLSGAGGCAGGSGGGDGQAPHVTGHLLWTLS
jgi:hypothetical protein